MRYASILPRSQGRERGTAYYGRFPGTGQLRMDWNRRTPLMLALVTLSDGWASNVQALLTTPDSCA